MNETIQIHESPQCDEAMHTQTRGEGNLPSIQLLCKYCNSSFVYKINNYKQSEQYYCKHCKKTFHHRKHIVYPCKQCGELISNSKSLNKKYCDSCHYKRKREYDERWRKDNPDKFKLQQIRKSLRENRSLHIDISFCIDCGKDISDRPGNAIYCITCAEEHRKINLKKNSGSWYIKNHDKAMKIQRERRWRYFEKNNIRFEKRTLITNCVICGKDISMYHSNCKYCSNCSERRSYHTLGTTDFSSHMVRKYNDVMNKVVPDWIAEREAINSQLNLFNLDDR